MVSTRYVQPLRHHIGSLADIGHVVQESPPLWPPAIGPRHHSGYSADYWRTGGALVGQGDAGWVGAAVIGAGAAAAAGCGRAAGFFVAGFLAAGFLVPRGCGAAGVSSTTTGLGPKRGGSPVA